MALHSTPASMLKESLDEYIEAARLCIMYKKTDPKWGEFQSNGCLGYPSALILFSIVDSIGSYLRKNPTFKANIDGEKVSINSEGWEHFKILNSKYFKQNLTIAFIKVLYTKFRSYLVHNSILGDRTIMYPEDINLIEPTYFSRAFAIKKNTKGEVIYAMSLKYFFEYCETAVELFIKDIDSIVPFSKPGKKFH